MMPGGEAAAGRSGPEAPGDEAEASGGPPVPGGQGAAGEGGPAAPGSEAAAGRSRPAAPGSEAAAGGGGPAARDPELAPADGQVPALRAEIARLNKVVDALMDRSEASMNVQGSDFGLFQTTIMLQDQVRLQTAALESALRDKELDAGGGSGASVSRDMQTLRRTAALQIQLLELVVQQKDVGELVNRVASILDIPIVLFDTRGRVVHMSRSAATSPDLARKLWSEYLASQGPPNPEGMVTAAGERIFYRDVSVMGRAERVLAAVASRHGANELSGASLLFLQQLVTLDLLRGRDELRMRRRLRRGLLRDVLAGDAPPEELRIRLQAQGFDDDSVKRLAIVETQAPAEARSSSGSSAAGRFGTATLRAVEAFLSERRFPYLTSSKGSLAVILTELPDAERSTARALLAGLRESAMTASSARGTLAACSAPLAGVAGAARGLRQAKAACLAARHAPHPGDLVVFEELTGHFRLLDGLDEEGLMDVVQRTFGPLLEYDARHHAALYDTLRALFDHRLAVQETADALHIHRNTLQKRLANVERLLGADLNDLDTIVGVSLGLHAAELLEEPLP